MLRVFAMTLASWIPPYLARLGMEFNWSVKLGGLVWLFTGLKFALTAYFGADVDAHRAAYLTGVLAVFAFAALAASVDVWQKRKRLGWRKPFRIPPLFLLALAVFAASLLWVIAERPVGAAIAAAFIGLVLIVSLAQPRVAINRVPIRRLRVRGQGDRVRMGATEDVGLPDPRAVPAGTGIV